jgi:Xaa-Pro aminopeptidase
VVCEELYQMALERVRQAGFADYFMGVEQKARFIGHGVGLEINESPVIASRIATKLEPGMVFALEPKIVLPGVGPLGIENTWVVTPDGVEKLTNAPEEIVLL